MPSDPVAVLRQLPEGQEVELMPGLRLKKLPHTGFCCVTLHYTVTPNRRNPAWAKAASAKYGTKGIESWKWRQEMEIDFTAASGEPVYANYREAVHVMDDFPIPADWPRWVVYDPGGVNPHAVEWWAMDPTPPDWTLYCYRQWYKGLEMPDGSEGGYYLAADVLRIIYTLSVDPDGRPERFKAVIVDPQARATQASAGDKANQRTVTIYEELQETADQLGWDAPLYTGNNLKDTAIDDVMDRLGNYPLYAEDDAGELLQDAEGNPVPLRDARSGLPLMVKPRLFIFRSCRWVYWEMGLYRWADWSSDAVAEQRNRPEKPVDKNDHSMTNLVRLMNWLRRDPMFDRRVTPRPTKPDTKPVHDWRKRLRSRRRRGEL